MKVLLAPSESKNDNSTKGKLNENSLFLGNLYGKRVELLSLYDNFLKTSKDEEIAKLFGIKDLDKAKQFITDIFNNNTEKAILRYDGVAFDYLDYNSLNNNAQNFVDENVIIFSNLFGPILAKDLIPNYKLKQGESIGNTKPEKFYKENFSNTLDEFLDREELVLDLRAGFYDKFYKPSKETITMKFLKDGKSVSHWAKAYRGLITKYVAKNNIQTREDLLNLEIENLKLENIEKVKTGELWIYSIYE